MDVATAISAVLLANGSYAALYLSHSAEIFVTTSLLHRLGLSEQEIERAGTLGNKIFGHAEFLEKIHKALDATSYPEALAKSTSWFGLFGDAVFKSASEALPAVKFVAELVKKLTTVTDPDKLAGIACSLAWQAAVTSALRAEAHLRKAGVQRDEITLKYLKNGLDSIRWVDRPDFSTFTFATALEHPFVREAVAVLDAYAPSLGFDGAAKTRLLVTTQARFHRCLQEVLCHPDTKDRFDPVLRRMHTEGDEVLARNALVAHAALQRRLFEQAPVLGREPFALTHVYIHSDCGLLRWEQMRRKDTDQEVIDPFLERHGGRHPLLETVFQYLDDPSFREALVIQGVAGSGKSSFTLRLCTALLDRGLIPIRVRLRDVMFQPGFRALEALSRAVRHTDPDDPQPPEISPIRPSDGDLFLNERIFREKVPFGAKSFQMCPYVLILDGWDELSITAEHALRSRLEQLLVGVRQALLDPPDLLVRVIVTGRPSADLYETAFLKAKTPVLTMRLLTPEQLRGFVQRVANGLNEHPVALPEPEAAWSIPNPGMFDPVIKRYEAEFEKERRQDLTTDRAVSELHGSLAVLGLPLLAHLGLRLMASWSGDLRNLVESPTRLYRSLVDLTCARSGQPPEYPLEPDGRQRIAGNDLRALLRETAVSLTTLGVEHISRAELAERVELDDPGLSLDGAVRRSTKEHVLSSLLVSYYFKGGHPDAGCEFVHKSFREYLFAEAIVEALKGYARKMQAWNKQNRLKPDSRPPPRKLYWQDFEGSLHPDPRHALSRRLARLLAPQWLSREVALHLWSLLELEVNRSKTLSLEHASHGNDSNVEHTTRAAALNDWEIVRDGIADLWEWWMEGVHLRPQPVRGLRGAINYERSLADELVGTWCVPLAPVMDPPAPMRTITLDSHLGDGLFRLAAWIHELVATATGWHGLAWNKHPFRPSSNPYQTRVNPGGSEWVFFRPHGTDPKSFQTLRARINASGWYPGAMFPGYLRARGIDLQDANADLGYFAHMDLRGAVLDNAGVQFSYFGDAHIETASMEDIHWVGNSFARVNATGTFVSFNDLEELSSPLSDLKENGALVAEEDDKEDEDEDE